MTSWSLGYFEQQTLITRTCRSFVRFTFTQGYVPGLTLVLNDPSICKIVTTARSLVMDRRSCSCTSLKILPDRMTFFLDDLFPNWVQPLSLLFLKVFFSLALDLKWSSLHWLHSNFAKTIVADSEEAHLKKNLIPSLYGSCSFMCSMIHVCVLVFTNLGRLLIWFVRLLCCIQLSRMTCLGGGSRFRQVLLLFPATSFSILALA